MNFRMTHVYIKAQNKRKPTSVVVYTANLSDLVGFVLTVSFLQRVVTVNVKPSKSHKFAMLSRSNDNIQQLK